MPLKDDLTLFVKSAFQQPWTARNAIGVPTPESLKFSNDMAQIDATVLYADLADSTKMVQTYGHEKAGEIYKSYLTCAAKVIKEAGGTITSYDGDRIMAVFMGNRKNNDAVTAALKINTAVIDIINPSRKVTYGATAYQISHRVGIDTGSLSVAKIGVKNDNDLVFIGRAANYAAKLATLNTRGTIFVMPEVYSVLDANIKTANGTCIWEKRTWTQMDGIEMYSTSHKMTTL